MSTTTISPKFQVVIPKEVREKLHLKSGQKMAVVMKGGVVYLIPEKTASILQRVFKGHEYQKYPRG